MPIPIALGGIGAILGLFGGGLNQCFPILVGTATGCSIGCAVSVICCFIKEQQVLPVAQVATVNPLATRNFYIVYELSEQDKAPASPKIYLTTAK
jgi:hypothetical protein